MAKGEENVGKVSCSLYNHDCQSLELNVIVHE